MRLTLASTSPRRKDLLGLLQVAFEVAEPDFPEASAARGSTGDPARQALRFAEGKAEVCARARPELLVLGCDTLIELNGEVLGKPNSVHEARSMLHRLQGREHQVHSAVALRCLSSDLQHTAIETVRVRMKRLSDDDIDRYLQSGEWMDKAGSYAIQGKGAELIEGIEGDYTAVVGLPLRLVAQLLSRHMTMPIDVESLYKSRPYSNWSRFSQP
jgi:septum formation protein